MKPLDSKLPNVGTTIFTVMSQLAEQHRAVNLSQGFPDFLPPAGLLERVEEALRGRYHQYAPMPGSVALRNAIAAKLAALYGVTVDPVAADHRHERRHRSDFRRDSGRRPPRRRGHRVRPLLRLV